MYLQRLDISQLRNLRSATLQFHPHLNLISGANASGKTSLLEAISLCLTGRSLRTARPTQAITFEQEAFTLFGLLLDESEQNGVRKIGYRRHRNGQVRLKVDGQEQRNLHSLATLAPLLFLTPECYDLIRQGPALRRRFLDWLVFHVEPSFVPVWQEYRRAFRQYDAWLKSRKGVNGLGLALNTEGSGWLQAFCRSAEGLNSLRASVFKSWHPAFVANCRQAGLPDELTVSWRRGWSREQELTTQLQNQFLSDVKRGYIGSGPHKAELVFRVAGRNAVEVLSRGQQKLLIHSLYLSCVEVLVSRTGKSCVFLVDDVSAELDQDNQRRLLTQLLAARGVQLFITSLNQLGSALEPLNGYNGARFHVEHGQIRPLHND